MSDSILNITSTGLLALQKSINTVGHNIVNANTPGYSRQVTHRVTADSRFLGGFFLGNGVQVSEIRQVVDNLSNATLKNNLSAEASCEKFLDYASRISDIISDPETGLASSFDEFYSALSDLTQDPSSIERRDMFLQKSAILVSTFNDLDVRLSQESDHVNQEIEDLLSQVNVLTANIANLNQSIMSIGLGDNGLSNANDLLDKRETLIQDLSKLINVDTLSPKDGSLTLFTKGGQSLVIGSQATIISSQRNTRDFSKLDLVVTSSPGLSPQIITDSIKGGQLGGLKSVQNEAIDTVKNQLGLVALTLAASFNAQHKLGIDLDSNQGKNFFNDVNTADLVRNRVKPKPNNTGNAIITAALNDPIRASKGTNLVFSNGQVLQNSNGLSRLYANNNLSINDVPIRATQVSDDILSSGPSNDNMASAIASSQAINDTSHLHGVMATPAINGFFLGTLTSNTGLTNQFQINGQNITFNASADNLNIVDTINQYFDITGVKANVDEQNQFKLEAEDGRNITLSYSGAAGGATFSHFDMTGNQAINKVQVSQLVLKSQTSAIKIGGTSPQNVGLNTGMTPAQPLNLTGSTYSLNYDGNIFQLIRDQDRVVVNQSNVFDASHPMLGEGFTLNTFDGNFSPFDSYAVNPLILGAAKLEVMVSNTRALALASPVMTRAIDENTGTGTISPGRVTGFATPDTSRSFGNAFKMSKTLLPPLSIKFINEKNFQIFDISEGSPGQALGPVQTYMAGQDVFPLANMIEPNPGGGQLPAKLYDPGYRVSINGNPLKGDVFNIEYNTQAVSDNRNALALSELQSENLLSQGSATLQTVFGQIITRSATLTQKMKTNFEQAQHLTQSIQERVGEYSGVNIEEEAANLIQLQQNFQFIAKILKAQNEMFDSLMSIFR